ncbi:MAG: Gldg family protein [Thermoguttaceae bacterium]|nr:Gldg family protein [Thermoguttaceae bacterium]
MNVKVLYAVFKRNLGAYFTSPLGYVFICVFVLLSAFAAFWSEDFFNTNLANLDQLNKVFPLIMLVFVPAITMSIWADERRQGTDELLLTIPAGDFDIVLGKYLAAVVIYTISLLFSLGCNAAVLGWLGDPDVGLFLGTYVGYWLVGLTMLAVGMVASFLTSNLTVAFILGAMFNAPLVFAAKAELLFTGDMARTVSQWSLGEQFRPFGRGILAFSGLVYFGAVVAVMLYLSVVLIGRRHLRTGQGMVANHVFYPAVHLLWLLSFVTFWLFFRRYFDDAAVLVILAVLYPVVHLGLLWGWSSGERSPSTAHAFAVLPWLHGACLTAFALAAALVEWYMRQTDVTELPWWRPVLFAGFALYAAVHAGLLWGWLRWPPKVAVMPGHYIARVVALALVALGANGFFSRYDLRIDVTSEKLSTLSHDTIALLKGLEPERTIHVEAFISPSVPEAYVQTRLNLISMLEEIRAVSGNKIEVRIYDTEPFTEQATRAREQYNITPRDVRGESRGAIEDRRIFMGVAFRCGLQKVVVPFVDLGTPVEYELARSVATVTQQKRKRVGVLRTDAQLFGEFDMQTFSKSNNWPLIDELQKGYEVVQVDPSQPITERYDVLLAVQPSTLGPEPMKNFIAAVQAGQPTAIFEDPFPAFTPVGGTLDPKRPPMGGMMNPMMMQGMQKGDIEELWKVLEVNFSGMRKVRSPARDPFTINLRDDEDLGPERTECDIVWQKYNGVPKLADLNKRVPEFVFLDRGAARRGFNDDDPITSNLQRLWFPFPGYIQPTGANHEFIPLVQTGDNTGVALYSEVSKLRGSRSDDTGPRGRFTGREYVLAARIRAKNPAGQNPDAKSPASKVNVILVPDVDVFSTTVFRFRDQPELAEGLRLDFDNVAFVLNVLDELAGDDRFLEIRKRRHIHRTLTRIEEVTEKSRRETVRTIDNLLDDVKKAAEDERAKLRRDIKQLREQMQSQNLSAAAIDDQIGIYREEAEKRLNRRLEEQQQKVRQDIEQIQTRQQLELRQVQDRYKMAAVLLPPIPPLLVAIGVLFLRRMQEREGVSRSRLRS